MRQEERPCSLLQLTAPRFGLGPPTPSLPKSLAFRCCPPTCHHSVRRCSHLCRVDVRSPSLILATPRPCAPPTLHYPQAVLHSYDDRNGPRSTLPTGLQASAAERGERTGSDRLEDFDQQSLVREGPALRILLARSNDTQRLIYRVEASTSACLTHAHSSSSPLSVISAA